ncbi:hypothetical protein ATE84_2934 [Aquimarina sp. MAR_2010_214]|uniref:hypothetical protein n=1 Tax=Aquimarina sp. MAR_2010_214 TaxID=1250026 RepID=UPI000C70EC88|nr:hypothetical protein [Aquimarina sp. MAR_2010_214]PKV50866.1 hypothetical protein ATE84_2934 [Aquimarina sp. MAR_2010_214]
MKTDEGLQYFLSNKTITDYEYAELVKHYFKADKTDWYKQNGTEKQWDEVKVKQFWKLIRMHSMPRGKEKELYDFKGFVFPEFVINEKSIENFWKSEEEKQFEFEVSFWCAAFLGIVNFSKVVFLKKIELNQTNFFDSVVFSEVCFKEEANFVFAHFLCEKKKFGRSCNRRKVEFTNVVFFREALFLTTKFYVKTYFSMIEFKGYTGFQDAEFHDEVIFGMSNFSGKAEFNKTKYVKKTTFSEIKFQGMILFQALNFIYNKNDKEIIPLMSFESSPFANNVTFRQVNLTTTYFYESDIAEARFKECSWNETYGRLVLANETLQTGDLNYFKMLEELYRQLKKNFDSNKDWELSGKAYVSEMEMRKHRLFNEKQYFSWFIYWFYGFFGGYTQNFKRPIMSLLGLIGLFSFMYYFIDHSWQWAIQRGIYGALPKLITIDIPEDCNFEGYWLIASNIETLLGSTFLVFFILALRKRFKQ